MSKLELVRAMYEYNEWANDVILEACAPISEEQLRGKQTISHDSISTLLVHIVGAQVFWLARWKGEPFPCFPQVGEGPVLPTMRESFAAYHSELRDYIGGVTDARLDEMIPLPEWADRMRGKSLTLWQVMMQISEHGIHHRAEIQSALTALGHPVQDLDYILYAADRGGS